MMNYEQLRKFRAIFQEQRAKLVYSQQILNAEFHLQRDDLMDEVDLTTTELEHSMRIRLRNREALYLKKIDEALRRIDEGTFGECESCGDDIEPKRLEARPTTTQCVNCKEEAELGETKHIDGHRPKSLGSRLMRLA
jgi:DnaK suppressor protein